MPQQVGGTEVEPHQDLAEKDPAGGELTTEDREEEKDTKNNMLGESSAEKASLPSSGVAKSTDEEQNSSGILLCSQRFTEQLFCAKPAEEVVKKELAPETEGSGGLGLDSPVKQASSSSCSSSSCCGGTNPVRTLEAPKSPIKLKSACHANPDGTLQLPVDDTPKPPLPEAKPESDERVGSLRTTVTDPAALHAEGRDMPPFDPAYAEQYLI